MELEQALRQKNLNIEEGFVKMVLSFAEYLRTKDYTISTPSLINFFTLVPEYNIFEFEDMFLTMRSLFSKTRFEYVEFENNMRNYFFKSINEKNDEASRQRREEQSEVLKKQYEQMKQDIEEEMNNISVQKKKGQENDDLKEFLENNQSYVDRMLKETKTESLKDFLSLNDQKMADMLRNTDEKMMEELKKQLNNVMIHNINDENNPEFNKLLIESAEMISKINKKIDDTMKKGERALKEIEKRMTANHRPEYKGGYRAVKTIEDVLDKNITKLSQGEHDYLRDFIQMNSAKFRTRISRTMKFSRKKEFDIKRTIKQSTGTFGDIVHLCYKKPIVKKTRIVCVADVSGSVVKHTKFLLQFVYELSSVFRGGVKSFVFVDDVVNITDLLINYDINESIDMATESVNRGYSNYGRAFKSFVDNEFGILDKNTIFIILGDARNNKNDTGSSYLKQIKEKVKAVVWLVPEEVEKWNTGDSILDEYTPFVDSTYKTTTVNEMITFLNELEV